MQRFFFEHEKGAWLSGVMSYTNWK